MTHLRALALLVALLVGAGIAAAQQPSRPVNDQQVYEVAVDLRCVVCQNLSVADSPSEMATQMRAIVRERLAAGDSPAQVRQYFVERYGEWILLEPKMTGLNIALYAFPVLLVIGGLAFVVVLVRRWTSPPAAPGDDHPAPHHSPS